MENSTAQNPEPAPAGTAKPTPGAALVEGAGIVGSDVAGVVVAVGTAVVDTAKAVVDVSVAAGREVAHAVEPRTPTPAAHPAVGAEAAAPAA